MRYLNKNNLAVLLNALGAPLTAFQAWKSTFRPVDRRYATQVQWVSGRLPRRPLEELFPAAIETDLQIRRAGDRLWGMSITVEELCALLTMAKALDARNVLEIGTWDGNTALNLAENIRGTITTVDLPPDHADKTSTVYEGVPLNLTPREEMGRQLAAGNGKVRQVFGDSARLDWSTLGGPFDLVFIDACHQEPYVRSDTQNALKHVRRGGLIVWHDYGMVEVVSNVVDEVANRPGWNAFAIEGTRLAVAWEGTAGPAILFAATPL